MLMFFDVETTGLPTTRHAHWTDINCWPRIVSIAWTFSADGGNKAKVRSAIIRPVRFHIPNEAAQIHGITTDRAAKEGLPAKSVFRELIAALERHKPNKIIAHNIAFDRPVLLAELHRARLKHHIEFLATDCTMLAGSRILRSRWPKLPELHKSLFGKRYRGVHQAMADVRACMRCYFEIQRRTATSADLGESAVEHDEQRARAEQLVSRILDWATYNDWFDTNFPESVKDQVESGRRVTDRQIVALENIIDRCDVP